MKRHIPNSLTLANLFCGCAAIVCLFNHAYEMTFWLVFAAGWLDLGDGIAARVLNVKSEMGKELDSLADMVTFGVLPGAVMYSLIQQTGGLPFMSIALSGFIITIGAALRLAKFNIDTREANHFFGVPTPANAAFILGLFMVWHTDAMGWKAFYSPYLLVGISVISALLLVSEIPMFNYKMKNFSWKGNEVRYLYIPVGLATIPFLGWASIPVGFVLYLAFSFIDSYLLKR